MAWDRYTYANNNPLNYTDPSGHFAIPIVIITIGTEVIVLVAGVTLCIYVSMNPEVVNSLGVSVTDIIGEQLEREQEKLNTAAGTLAVLGTIAQATMFSRGDGGAESSARHTAMLLGEDVAGFSGHPGMPDPSGRDRKHNAEGLRNDLDNMVRNREKGESIQDYLSRQGWSDEAINNYTDQVQTYINDVMQTDIDFYNLSEKTAQEILDSARLLGIIE